ncbi:MAG: phospholipase [Candidatus Omnitrophica bacterium]|nr:phospholipase [Candidatus Omnitrophota bacterium]
MNENLQGETDPILHHSVAVSIAGHYLLKRPTEGEGRALLVGFHGYAENAETQLDRLSLIPGSENDWLCAIQALHPFYRRQTGEVVASWMTRFHREGAIRENMAFFERVLTQIRREVSADTPLVLLGFSQGSAMAYRSSVSATHPPKALVILGGDVPPDLTQRDPLILPPILLGRGSGDRLYSEEQFRSDQRLLESKGVTVSSFPFEGEHEWNEHFAAGVSSFLTDLLQSEGT